jgi:hypothetical protein
MGLNANEIKKALECCTTNGDCPKCLYNDDTSLCINRILKDALSLIKKLTEESERLHASCTELTRKCASLEADVAKEFTCVFGTPHKVSECPINDEVAKAKSDTVRKMQELIAEHATNGYPRKVRLDVVDQIAKEMESANG